MILVLSLAVLLGIFLTLLGLFSIMREYDYSIGESFSYAVVIYFGFYSSIIQILFIFRIPYLLYLIDIVIICASIYTISRNLELLISSFKIFANNFIENKSYTIPFGILWLYLLFQVILLPPHNCDSMVYNLSRVVMMQQENSLFLTNYITYRQVNLPIGFDILAFVFLRFYSDYFLAIFSFLSYSVLIVSNYSLVNKVFHNTKLSLTSAIIIGSLIEIVLQSTSTKNDLPSAAMGIVAFMAAYNYLKVRDFFSLIIMATSLLLGLTFKGYFLGFVMPFSLLFIIIYFKKYSFSDVLSNIKSNKKLNYLLLLLPISVFICFITFGLNNYIYFGGFFGHGDMVDNAIQKHGLKGAGLNAARYWLQTLNLPANLGGKYIDQIHDNLLLEKKGYGTWGKAQDGEVKLSTPPWPFEDSSSFGPLGFFIIFPSLIYSIFKGNNFIRFVSLSLLSFFLSICYMIGWMPWNNRFFSLFFGGSGLCIGLFLNNVIKKKYFNLLIILSFIFFAYAAFLNTNKPFFNKYEIGYYINQNIIKVGIFKDKKQDGYKEPGWWVFNWLQYVVNRDLFYEQEYGHQGLSSFKTLIKQNKRVLILSNANTIFPYLIRRPDLFITVAGMEKLYYDKKYYNLQNLEDFNFIKSKYDYILFLVDEPTSFLQPTQLIASYRYLPYLIFHLYDLNPCN